MSVKINNIGKITGFKVTEPRPVDDRMFFSKISDVEDFVNTSDVTALHDGLRTRVDETGLYYIWMESDIGLLDNSFPYDDSMLPEYSAGFDYRNKKYNFVIDSPVVEISKTMNGVDDFISIHKRYVPGHVLSASLAEVILKEEGDSEITYPHSVEWEEFTMKIRLYPVPSNGIRYTIKIG